MHTVSNSILLNANSIQSSDIQPFAQFSHGRQISDSPGNTTKIPAAQENMSTHVTKSIFDSRAIKKFSDPSITHFGRSSTPNRISIIDIGKSFDSEVLWEDIEYYLRRLINVSPDHLEIAKHYLSKAGDESF